jgi:hypothetical protein
MSGTKADVARAQAEARAARERIDQTLTILRMRLDPRVRARETWADVRERGQELGDDAVEFAYERPTIIASAAGAGAFLLLRRPIFRLVRRLFVRKRRPKWDAPEPMKNPVGAATPRPGKEGVRR